jgi:hypothetical protein
MNSPAALDTVKTQLKVFQQQLQVYRALAALLNSVPLTIGPLYLGRLGAMLKEKHRLIRQIYNQPDDSPTDFLLDQLRTVHNVSQLNSFFEKYMINYNNIDVMKDIIDFVQPV